MKNGIEAKNYNFIDLFAGCGGLSLGALKVGFKGVIAIESQKNAFNTLKHNLVDSVTSSLRTKSNVEGFEWPDSIEKKNHDINSFLFENVDYLKSLKGKIDLVVGGPPCQGFSNAGKRKEDDPRNQLYKSYLSFVKYVEPKILLIENVAGIASKFSKTSLSYKDNIIENLKKDYYVDGQLLSSEIFGVPQKRKRYIIIGFKKTAFSEKIVIKDVFKKIEAEAEEFAKEYKIGDTLFDIRNTTVSMALADLDGKGRKSKAYTDENAKFKPFKTFEYKEPNSDYQRIMRFSLNGSKRADSHRIGEHTLETKFKYNALINITKRTKRDSFNFTNDEFEEAQWNSKKQIISVLKADKPSPTLTTCPFDYIHYNSPRILTVREYARIQSFPDWFEFKGIYATSGSMSYTTPRYTQIGNAVPPLMAEGILKTLKSYLK
jgi:DNA (cytosine-5)-methyltransferase 1